MTEELIFPFKMKINRYFVNYSSQSLTNEVIAVTKVRDPQCAHDPVSQNVGRRPILTWHHQTGAKVKTWPSNAYIVWRNLLYLWHFSLWQNFKTWNIIHVKVMLSYLTSVIICVFSSTCRFCLKPFASKSLENRIWINETLRKEDVLNLFSNVDTDLWINA